ncbi:MAG: hypothetical protein QM765_02400 [Myxococcales bacterium]
MEKLDEALVDGEGALGVAALVAGGVALRGDGVVNGGAGLVAQLVADREADRAVGEEREEVAGGVEGQDGLLVQAAAGAGEGEVVLHGLGDGAGTAEEVERHAPLDDVTARGDADRVSGRVRPARAERVLQAGEDERALLELGAGVAAVVGADVPVPAAQRAHALRQVAVDAADDAEGVLVLLEAPAAELHQAAADIGEVAAEGVVEVLAADGQALGVGEERLGREDLVGLAVDERGLEVGLGRVAQLQVGVEHHVEALLRRDQVVGRCVVVVVAALALDARVAEGPPAAVVSADVEAVGVGADQVVPGLVSGRSLPVDDHALGDGGGADGGDLAAGEVVVVVDPAPDPVAGPCRLLAEVAGAEEHVGLVELVAGGQRQVDELRVAPLRDAAEGGDLGARPVLAGDDVDHAADGVGAVDGRGAVLEDLDPLDGGHGDGVQVDGGVGAGAARDEAAAVDEHEGAGRAEAAQVDAGRAVAAVVVLGVDGVGLRGQRLEDVADRRAAGAGDLLAGHHGDRSRRVEVGAVDARTGDDDLLDVGGCGGRRRHHLAWLRLGFGLGRGGRVGRSGRRSLGGRCSLGGRGGLGLGSRCRCGLRLREHGVRGQEQRSGRNATEPRHGSHRRSPLHTV